ncbi:MAG TPA: M28 family peptidase [Nitrospiraceae bacterium]|nr:M28 family peptidase [Nitrospiraceae bacterium]
MKRRPPALFLLITIVSIVCGTLAYHFIAMVALDPTQFPPTSDLARRLQTHVQFLASTDLQGRKPGTLGHRKAADYIVTEFQKAGLEPLASLNGYRQTVSQELGDNLIGIRPASNPHGSGWILIGAHYDHLGGAYLGADDNASAVGILLELARSLPSLTNDPVIFAAFNTEEAPYIRTGLMGSQHFTDHLPAEIGSLSRLQAVIIMDLMGGVHWEPLQEILFAAGAEQSPGLYRRVKEAAMSGTIDSVSVLPIGLHLVEEIPLIGRVAFSDYDAFRNASVPFLFLSAGRTPRYHQPSDLPNTLHYERMAATVPWLAHLIGLIDQDTVPYRFEKDRLEFSDEIHAFRPLVIKSAEEPSKIPGTSALSLWKQKQDRDWLDRLDLSKATREDVKRLERLSIRMQCLLSDMPGCFLL